MEFIVSLDIETTGLDPNNDAIIEIGLVRFNGHRIEDEWTKLIHPGKRIPPFITQLTGITDQMILQAPSIQVALPELVRFIGRSPVLGHSVRFDLSFLRKYKILESNDALDTYELAAVLLPTASRYNLGSLAQSLQILLPATHRALDDARVTRAVYLRLLEEAEQLPLSTLAEILRLAESIEWSGFLPLQEVLKKRSRETISARQVRSSFVGPIFSSHFDQTTVSLEPVDQLLPLDIDETAAVLEQGGAFSRHFPQYEFRPQQIEMLRKSLCLSLRDDTC